MTRLHRSELHLYDAGRCQCGTPMVAAWVDVTELGEEPNSYYLPCGRSCPNERCSLP